MGFENEIFEKEREKKIGIYNERKIFSKLNFRI